MKEKPVEDAVGAGRLPCAAIRIPVSTSAPKGAATKDENECVPGQQANAIDIRVVRLGDDTEKPWGYQEKLPCLRERNEGMEKTSEPRSGFVL